MKRIFLRQPELGIPSNVLREYKALQMLHHDNIVQLLDVFAMVRAPWTQPVPCFCLTTLNVAPIVHILQNSCSVPRSIDVLCRGHL
jgi:hypothetical protein